jgi:hypothetical protein
MTVDGMASVPQPCSAWLAGSGAGDHGADIPARGRSGAARSQPCDQGVEAMEPDTEVFHEHLRPAWHVVVATLVVLAAAVLTSWLGH